MSASGKNIREGDVVFLGWQHLVVVEKSGARWVACPLVAGHEARHRSDIDLSWIELSEAGLSVPDVRLRAVACCREGERGVRFVGTVGSSVVRRARDALFREYAQRDRNFSSVKMRVVSGSSVRQEKYGERAVL
ncbi:hypothetical protein [Kozakia baliensis]|uniref:hypothetical protein n=1 Tax=Kozakia baliensis TaxID=153496 RepID=UPI0012450469|nr:hypothetical protein [Kozakia baliensis]